MQASTKETLLKQVELYITNLIRESYISSLHSKREPIPLSINSNASTLPNYKEDRNFDKVKLELKYFMDKKEVNDEKEIRKKRIIQSEDVNLALQWRGSEKVNFLPSSFPSSINECTSGNKHDDENLTSEKNKNNSKLSFQKNTRNSLFHSVELNEVINAPYRYYPPTEIGTVMHWLAVDGVQSPNVSLNSFRLSPKFNKKRCTRDAISLMYHIDEESDSDDDEKSNNISVRRLLPHILSEELRLYFDRVTLILQSGPSLAQNIALATLRKDVGLQELVPFFTRFLAHQIYTNLNDIEKLKVMVMLADAMISNPMMYLELYLHRILPVLLTCVVARKLGSIHSNTVIKDKMNNATLFIRKNNRNNARNEPSQLSNWGDDHWSLRELAARTVYNACSIYGENYTTLKARVIRTFCEAFVNIDSRRIIEMKALGSIYGGICAMCYFGPLVVDAFVLPLIGIYWTKWEEELSNACSENDLGTNCDTKRRFYLQRCQDIMLRSLGVFFGTNIVQRGGVDCRFGYYTGNRKKISTNVNIYEYLENLFGEKLIPLAFGKKFDNGNVGWMQHSATASSRYIMSFI